MKSFGVRSRRYRDGQPASLKQRFFGYFCVCFLSSTSIDDEGKSSSGGSSLMAHHTKRSERQARKKLSSCCGTTDSVQADSLSARTNTNGLSKKHRGSKVNIWKRRVNRWPAAATSLTPPATAPTKPFWKVFSKSGKCSQATQTGPAVNPPVNLPKPPPTPPHPSSTPWPPEASHVRAPSASTSSTWAAAAPHQPTRSQKQNPVFFGAKPIAHFGTHPTFETGGNGGVHVQNSLHSGAKTEAWPDSTPTAARSDAVSNPACERLQKFNSPRCPKPAQSEDSAAPPAPQVATASEHQSSVSLVADHQTAPCETITKNVSTSSSISSSSSSSSPNNKHKPAAPTAEPSSAILMGVGPLVLGWYGVQALFTALWGSAEFALPPTHAPACEEAVTVGLSQSLLTVAYSWSRCISTSKVAVAICYGLLFSSKADRALFVVAASCFVAAAVAHHLAAAAEAALVLCVGTLWAAATAMEVLLKGCAAALMTPSLVITATLLASTALFCLVEAAKCCIKDSHQEAAHAPKTGPEVYRGSHVSASSGASSTSSSGSSRDTPSNTPGSSSNRSCHFEEMASDSTLPASREAWSWRNLLCKRVLVEASNNKNLIKAVHVPPDDFSCGNQHQALQSGASETEKLSALPRMACGKGCVGLRNPSLNCYANAVLQCLTAIPEWSQYFLSGSAERGPGQLERPVTAALSALLRTMWLSRGPVNPMALLRKLGDKNACWSEGRQQDCHDFLLSLLETLEDEVNRVTGPKPYLESLSGEGNAEQQADEAWQYCRSRGNSPIHELFTGQLQTRTTCSCCGHHSLHFDEFQTLSLKFPHRLGSQLGLTLQELFAKYGCSTTAEFQCDQCGAKEDASQQQSVCRWPHILVLQLARFSTNEAVPLLQRFASYQKDRVSVSTPGTLVPLELISTHTTHHSAPTFELSSVVDHEGSLHGGHYTARCRSSIDGCWHLCNDSNVYSKDFDGGMSDMPYLLFYRRKN